PDVLHALEVIALVAADVHQLHDAPSLKLLEARTDVRARNFEGLDDVVGVERIGRDVEQCVDLGDGAVDAPSGAHLAPVTDELLLNGGKLLSFSHFCLDRNYRNYGNVSSPAARRVFRPVSGDLDYGSALQGLDLVHPADIDRDARP